LKEQVKHALDQKLSLDESVENDKYNAIVNYFAYEIITDYLTR
jgi:hypothetical protein